MTDTFEKPLADYSKRTHGAKTMITWTGLKNGSHGKAYEVSEPGQAAVIIDGEFTDTGCVMIKGSNNGKQFHSIAGKIRPGPVMIEAVPAFLAVEAYGGPEMDVAVSIAFTKAE